jgi:hypothetical protein
MGISWRLSAGTFGIFALVACSSSQTVQGPGGTGPTGEVDRGVDPGTGQEVGQGAETNPYGVPYPTKNIGYQARRDQTPGNIIKNYKFLGHHGDTSKLQTISLADFFDPEMRQYKVIHLVASARWCTFCVQETKAVIPMLPTLKEKKVVFVGVLTDGMTQGKGATPTDLLAWINNKEFPSPIPTDIYPVMLDPDVKNLGQFFDAASLPWNANIDARSMEILSSGVGYNTKLAEEIDQWVQWVDSNPAQKQ